MKNQENPKISYWNNRINDSHHFSIVPYLRKKGVVKVYENSIQSNFGFNQTLQNTPPTREPDDIKTFSKKSRLRLFNLFTQINYSNYGFPLFVSATFHDDSGNNKTDIKSFLKKFYERLQYNLPPTHLIWKLEYQERGVPHFHFMLLPVNSSDDFRKEKIKKIIRQHWLELKTCKCKYCKAYAINIKNINEYEQAFIYIAKELGKIQNRYEGHNLGRIWGNSRTIRKNPEYQIEVYYEDFRKMLSSIQEKDIVNKSGEVQLIAMKDFALDSQLWIQSKFIQEELYKLIESSRKISTTQASNNYKNLTMSRMKFRGKTFAESVEARLTSLGSPSKK